MSTPLRYYFLIQKQIVLVIFNRYTIDTNGVIVNKETGKTMSIQKKKAGYNKSHVYDDNGKRRMIYIGRAIASTFIGPPPTPEHTADHEDTNCGNDTADNIRWLDRPGQNDNRTMPDTLKSAFIIVKDEIEKTNQEWVEHLKDRKNTFGREYTEAMIKRYAQNEQFGFAYKKYPDLPGEVWKEITGSKTKLGRWEISNMNRVKNITKYAENVLSGERLGLLGGYPRIVLGLCHILAFAAFYPDEYAAKKPEEIIKHIGDNKLDFRPHMLQIGTNSENCSEAHDNGCHNGTKSERVKCASYINGVLEKEHDGKSGAMRYLKSIGYDKASDRNIEKALSGDRKTAYGRAWKLA